MERGRLERGASGPAGDPLGGPARPTAPASRAETATGHRGHRAKPVDDRLGAGPEVVLAAVRQRHGRERRPVRRCPGAAGGSPRRSGGAPRGWAVPRRARASRSAASGADALRKRISSSRAGRELCSNASRRCSNLPVWRPNVLRPRRRYSRKVHTAITGVRAAKTRLIGFLVIAHSASPPARVRARSPAAAGVAGTSRARPAVPGWRGRNVAPLAEAG